MDEAMSREKILQIIKDRGPVLPVQISKEIGTNILFASAMLSELVARKELKVSNLKIGSSPLYFIPGQEHMLENFIDKLNEKDKVSYTLIKEEKLVRDNEETPLTRVALRSIKDFAIPLEVTHNNRKEIFWKWYKLDNKDAEGYIKKILDSNKLIAVKKDEKIEQKKEKVKLEKEQKQKREEVKVKLKDTKKDSFYLKLEDFLKKAHFTFKDSNTKKHEGLLGMESSIGDIIFYYITKNKKNITEKDIGEAVAQSQLQNLPVIILSSGNLNRKASIMLEKFKNIYFRKIDENGS